MEIVAGELASRLVGVLLRPSSLIVYALVSLALTTGLASQTSLLIENTRSSRSRLGTM